VRSATAIAIPWGDLATAWFSTGIPNIETYAVVPRAAAIAGPTVIRDEARRIAANIAKLPELSVRDRTQF
jgi:short subunit dehydrogenase-like uncharacterized protein